MNALTTKNEVTEVKALLSSDVSELKAFIADVKAELIKWMFVFWIGYIVTITGIMITVLRFFPGK